MKVKKTASMIGSTAVIGACFIATAAIAAQPGPPVQGLVVFHGQLVSAGCNVQPSSGTGDPRLQRLQVNAGISLEVGAARDACGQGALPLVTHYAELPDTDLDAHNALVTLTYQ